MTDFQKEVGLAAVVLVFFSGCFCCAGIVHTETAGRSKQTTTKRTMTNENCESTGIPACQLF